MLQTVIDLPIEDSHELVLTEEHPTHGIEYNMKQIVTNWFMGCAKNSGYMRNIVDTVVHNLKLYPNVRKPLNVTGPFMMTAFCKRVSSANDILLLDYQYLNPFPKQFLWKTGTIPPVPPKTVGLHHYVGTWWKPTDENKANKTEEAVFTIVTPTIGRRSLLKLKSCLRKEKTPYVHLVMWDKKKVSRRAHARRG